MNAGEEMLLAGLVVIAGGHHRNGDGWKADGMWTHPVRASG
ncbi:hypothetical protein [Luedemannella helvata]